MLGGVFGQHKEQLRENKPRPSGIVLDLRSEAAAAAGMRGPKDETSAPDQTDRFRMLL